MARTASRSRTAAAFLSRTVRLRPAPAGPEPAAASRRPFRFRGGGAKAGSKGPAKSGAKATKNGGKAKGGARPAARPARAERRPLPLPLRILAMLCAFVFMVAFAVVLAKLTLEPSPASVALTHTNLHPGRSLKAYLDQPALRDAVKQVGGNVLLGVPFGILVPVLAPRARGLLRVLLLTATVMLLVEFAQGALITGRAFDIDDVILNTGGALVGYLLLGRRLGRAVHARKQRRE